MKDLIIITDDPITPESASAVLPLVFPTLSLLANSQEKILMKRKKRGFELWFTPTDRLDNPSFFMGETIDKVPNKKAYLTDLCYSSKTVASMLIAALKPLYGRMWIQSEEEDDWFGTADEFLEVYCREVKD